MPRGPQGQKRPADAIGMAIMVGKIATGEQFDKPACSKRRNGIAGAAARQKNTTAIQRSAIAKKAAEARWGDK